MRVYICPDAVALRDDKIGSGDVGCIEWTCVLPTVSTIPSGPGGSNWADAGLKP